MSAELLPEGTRVQTIRDVAISSQLIVPAGTVGKILRAFLTFGCYDVEPDDASLPVVRLAHDGVVPI